MDEHELSTEEMERDFFRGAEVIQVAISILRETLEEAKQVFAANGWTEEEGLRIALTLGLAKIKTDQVISDDSLASLDTPGGLSDRLMQLDSLYAVMKYRAFHLMKDNQTLEIQNAALRNTIHALEGHIQRLNEEIAALKSGRGGGTARRIPGVVEPAPTTLREVHAAQRPAGLVRRILRRLGLGRSDGEA
ncbi:MAG: hypothetical protein QHH80_00300 [Anaerolineae bacterium]|jgi:glutamine synthetase type III|nr:hypothetical protein [Anaerolineae bacterium]